MPADFSQLRPENLRDFWARELPKDPCWIEPGVLPKRGKLLFGGYAKTGKSFIMAELGRALVTATNPFGAAGIVVPTPARILLVDQELSPWTFQDRTKKILAGVEPETLAARFRFVNQVRGLLLNDGLSITALIEWVKRTESNVLMLDPVGKMHHYNENDNQQITRLWEQIEKILDSCRDLDLSVVLSHHFGKPPRVLGPHDQTDELSAYNFRGASKWFDDPDYLITMKRLKTPKAGAEGKGWYVKTKWEPRGAEPPFKDGLTTLSVNRDDDFRVWHEPGFRIKKLKGKKDGDGEEEEERPNPW